MSKDNKPTAKWMKEQRCLHVETHNCIVNIRTDLTDRLGRMVTSIEILEDDFAGEPKKKIVGSRNSRVITLKKIN